eukprot:392163_1
MPLSILITMLITILIIIKSQNGGCPKVTEDAKKEIAKHKARNARITEKLMTPKCTVLGKRKRIDDTELDEDDTTTNNAPPRKKRKQSQLSHSSYYYHMNKEQQKACLNKMIYWIIKCAKTINTVATPEFISFVHSLNPS